MTDPVSTTPAAAAADEIRVPVLEETATVSKREVTTGRVVVRTLVDVEDRVLSQALSEDKVDVERIAIDRVVDVAPQMRTEGDVTIIPVLQERIVVEKQIVLVEEIHIRRRTSVETVAVPVQIRTQRAVVERIDGDGPP